MKQTMWYVLFSALLFSKLFSAAARQPSKQRFLPDELFV